MTPRAKLKIGRRSKPVFELPYLTWKSAAENRKSLFRRWCSLWTVDWRSTSLCPFLLTGWGLRCLGVEHRHQLSIHTFVYKWKKAGKVNFLLIKFFMVEPVLNPLARMLHQRKLEITCRFESPLHFLFQQFFRGLKYNRCNNLSAGNI